MAALPLEGIRVLQFGQNVAAPQCGRYFAEFGAEVIKIESRKKLDRMRLFMAAANDLPYDDMIDSSLIFGDYDRLVKSIQANLKKPEAVELIKKLIKISDVVIENYAPRLMKGLGLGYEDLRKINPRIIMLSLSAVGQEGPLRDIVTYGPTIASITPMQGLLGYADGEPAMDFASPDFFTAQLSPFYILYALRHRQVTGEGQFIDMGQVAPFAYTYGEVMMDYVMNKRIAKMQGNWRTGFCPNNVYRCKPFPMQKPTPADEQWISICVETEEEWESLCNVMGNPKWTKDEKFANRERRWENQEEMDKLIGEWTVKYYDYDLEATLQAAGVPAMVYPQINDRDTHPHLKAREVYKLIDYAVVPDVPTRPSAFHMTDIEPLVGRAPRLGEHNNYVYGELLRIPQEEIERMKKEEVIA